MDVVVLPSTLRQVVVDDAANSGDVQTPGSNGGGHQDGLLASLEIVQSLVPLRLETITVDGSGRQVLLAEIAAQEVSGLLGLHEDEGSLLGIAVLLLENLKIQLYNF